MKSFTNLFLFAIELTTARKTLAVDTDSRTTKHNKQKMFMKDMKRMFMSSENRMQKKDRASVEMSL